MNSNQFPSTDFQRYYGPQVPFLDHRPPEVVGEGDVIPANALDGSTQLYFVPALRRPQYPLYQANVTYAVPASSEYWYVRSICNENPSIFFNYHSSNVSGSQVFNNNLTRDNSYDYYANQYCQKFHNDNATSTTDIHYFYPSLRYGEHKLSLCAAVQTEYNLICYNCLHELNCQRNGYEEMCVDEAQTKSRYTTVEYACEKSSKLVATYMDASSNCAEGVGRATQTAARRIARSDVIATDEYVPRRRARRSSSSSGSCSRDCSCAKLC